MDFFTPSPSWFHKLENIGTETCLLPLVLSPLLENETRGLFLESPETFRAHFGWHNSLCIFKTKASRVTKLCSYCYFYSLYNIWKDQLYRVSRSEFYEWLFGPVSRKTLNFSGDIILFVSSKRRCSVSRNFAVILIFIPFTTYKKTRFTE